MSCIITYKGKKYSEEQFKEYFNNNKQEFATSIAKNKDVVDSFKRKMEGIDFVFSQSPELASIGSKAQYLQYLSTIFPGSQVKDIVYHGTHVKFDKFERGKRNFDGRKTNTEGFHLIAAVDKEYYRKKYKGLIAAIVNFKNPVSANNGNYEAALEYLSKRDIEQFNAMGFDSGIKFINDEDGSLEYVAFEPDQIHILGSKQDIEGFKEFIQDKPNSVKPGVEELFSENPELANEVYEALGFNFRYTSEKWKDDPTKSNEIIVKEELLSS